MDYSEYLRYKKQSCAQTIARNTCVDAGLRTDMLAKATNTTYRAIISTSSCCPTVIPDTAVKFVNTESHPIMPTERCSVTCSSFTDKYSAPFITIPGCPIPYTSTSYISKKCTPCYQGTQLDNWKTVGPECSPIPPSK
jgi:hypothetical protein